MSNWNLPMTFCFEGREVKYGIQGRGLPVILVHGTPWSSFNLRHLIEGLSLDYQVHYFDLLGYGESDKIPCMQAFQLQKMIAGAKVITIPESGHLVIEEKPEILVQKIRTFFEN